LPAPSDSGSHSSLAEIARSSPAGRRALDPGEGAVEERPKAAALVVSDGGRVEEGGGEERADRAGAPQAAAQPQMRQLQRARKCSFSALFDVARGPASFAASDPLAIDAQCLLTSPTCACASVTSDPGAAVRVHQLLDLRLRLLQRHPVSAALPFPRLLLDSVHLCCQHCSLLFITLVGMGFAMAAYPNQR